MLFRCRGHYAPKFIHEDGPRAAGADIDAEYVNRALLPGSSRYAS
jgi:hypothetical protein